MSDGERQPTKRELAILGVLWNEGPSTVRTVHGLLAGSTGVGYTTILKLMQIMAEKGLVERDRSSRTHVYRAAIGKKATQRQLVGDLLERAFGGSTEQLVVQALSVKHVSAAELASIRRLLDAHEGGGGR